MLEELLGNSGKMQEEMTAKLRSHEITEVLDGIEIRANAAKEILSISIDEKLMSVENKEQLEDQLIVLLNRTMASISDVEQKESAEMMKQMLPPGFDNLFG